MPDDDPQAPARRAAIVAARARHWQRTRRMTAVFLLLWLATSFCTVFFARELARYSVFGWPLSFYFAAQGSAVVYLAIVGIYAWRTRRLDRRFHEELA
jgi:putative solute:sodium symporter small subunit